MDGLKTKILGPERSYIALLDEASSKVSEKDSEERKFLPLRPSSAGKCTKELAFEYNEYLGKAKYPKDKFDANTHRLLDLGSYVERHLLDHFDRASKFIPFRTRYKQQNLMFFPLSNGEKVEGSIDAAFISPDFKCLIDVKSKKDKFSSFMSTNWDEVRIQLEQNPEVVCFDKNSYYINDLARFLEKLTDPFWAMNFYQLNFYFFDETNYIKTVGIDHAALIYYNKNDSRVREIRFKPNRNIYEKIKAKFLAIDKHISEGKAPEIVKRDYSLGSIKCAFCRFKEPCWGAGIDAKREFFSTFPKREWPVDVNRMDKNIRTELTRLHNEYLISLDSSSISGQLEEKLLNILLDRGIEYVKFSEDRIYRLVVNKTTGKGKSESFKLKRTKL